MRRALWYGAAGAPSWLNTVLLAERWHVPPWEVARHPGALRWLARQALVDDLRQQRAELDRKMAERKAK